MLSTVIYKQFAGPQIVNFEIGPPTIMEEEPLGSDTYWITGSPTVVDAYVTPTDIGSMIPLIGTPTPSPNPDKDTWGYVRFTVSALNGSEIASADIKDPVSGDPGHYQWTWDNGDAPTNDYIFTATAYSSSAQQGNLVSYGYHVEVQVPPQVTGVAGTKGNNYISLIWGASTVTDLDHYAVWRSEDGTNFTELVPSAPITAPNYTDDTAVNGIAYYYIVTAVDKDGNVSPDSAAAGPYTPFEPVDIDAPTVPGSFVGSQVALQNAITLTWLVSTDSGAPATGVLGYDLERKPTGQPDSAYTQVLSSSAFNQLTYTDTGLTWATGYTYRVRAVDVAGNRSAWAMASATTAAQPKWNLTVANSNTSAAITVWVQSLTTGRWYVGGINPAPSQLTPKPPGKSIAKKKSTIWYQLPQDTYNITTAGSQPQSVTLTGALTVTFSK